jgi:hypothetical protein
LVGLDREALEATSVHRAIVLYLLLDDGGHTRDTGYVAAHPHLVVNLLLLGLLHDVEGQDLCGIHGFYLQFHHVWLIYEYGSPEVVYP